MKARINLKVSLVNYKPKICLKKKITAQNTMKKYRFSKAKTSKYNQLSIIQGDFKASVRITF